MLFVAIGQLSVAGGEDAWRQRCLNGVLSSGVTILGAFEVANASTQLIVLLDAESVLDLRRTISNWEEYARFVVSPAIQVLPVCGPQVESSEHEQPALLFADRDVDCGLSRRHLFGFGGKNGPDPRRITSQGDSVPSPIRREVHPGHVPEHRLTRREREILRLISLGRSNRDIASALYISIRTVERHNANLYRKLGINRRSEAVAWWYRQEFTAQSA